MSYDVDIGPDSFNYTYNVAPLFHKHINGGLQSLSGMTGKQAFAVLRTAFDSIDREALVLWSEGKVGEPEFCARYDAPNGWGSTVGALMFLARIMGACAANPRCKVRVT